MSLPPEQTLCLSCGLCCDGVIFADVRLQPGEAPGHGKWQIKNGKLKQPCPALCEGRCQVYADRPRYCREFECALLKKVKAGQLEAGPALRLIKKARRHSEKVLRLLRELGCADETLSLAKRFRRMHRRLETEPIDAQTADLFGQLTLAVHELNLLLSRKFYPGE